MSHTIRTRRFNWLVRHYVATYLLMVACFVTFSVLSFDLFRIYSANATYIVENGYEGLRDGGLEQLAGLIMTTLFSVLAYLGFKICEQALVIRATQRADA